MNVAFQGEHGAYSELACYKFFDKNIKIVPCKALRDVFVSVEDEKADFGMIPIENSNAGDVYETYDLLLDFSLKVVGEEYLRIKHCLIGQKNATVKYVRKIYSHAQALAQCSSFLAKLNAEKIAVYDTAGAVIMIKKRKLKEEAAVASKLAAQTHGMKILKREIENDKRNTTRFFVVSKKKSGPSKNMKTSIVFSTQHKPGALYHCLEGFARNKINLTKIASRPLRTGKWEYFFYLDFSGGLNTEPVRASLDILKRNSYFVKVLGSYEAGKEAGR